MAPKIQAEIVWNTVPGMGSMLFFSRITIFNLQHMTFVDMRWFWSRRGRARSGWWEKKISADKKKLKGAKWWAAVTQDTVCRFDVWHRDVQWKCLIKLPQPPNLFCKGMAQKCQTLNPLFEIKHYSTPEISQMLRLHCQQFSRHMQKIQVRRTITIIQNLY